MQNLAYRIDVSPEDESSDEPNKSTESSDACAACGERLFGPDAEAYSWQAWGTVWKILGMSNVELVCGACGEYLSEFFPGDRE